MSETFTCESCRGTFDKGWSDEEAAAEAQENFPGIDISDADEAGVVCDDCYQHIMGRARAEAPELIGPGWRGGAASGDPIGDALRADAEEARAQIRAAGIFCPSCGVNMADLPAGHMLAVTGYEEAVLCVAECRDGTAAELSDFATWQAAANISLWDDFRRREAEAFKAIIGEGPADFDEDSLSINYFPDRQLD